jgi:hypothetical protein
MRILCIETHTGLADGAAERLRHAGHEVAHCFDPEGGPSAPCVGLDRDACPLDAPGGVDVVLDVRRAGSLRPTHTEAGATCALRRRRPLVVDGQSWPNPWARWTTVVVPPDGDVVEACDEAVRRRAADLGATVAIAARRALDGGIARTGAEVRTTVERRDGDLRVVIHRPADAAAADGEIAVRAQDALRKAGIRERSISISCTS